MLTVALRREVAPLLALEPVLNYYPRLACEAEPAAPITVWRRESSPIEGAIVGCDVPRAGWVLASKLSIARALLADTAPSHRIILSMWADSLLQEATAARSLETDALAVCTRQSFREYGGARTLSIEPVTSSPGEHDPPALAAMFPQRRVGCVVKGSLVGYCSYRLNGQGGGSVDELLVGRDWIRYDLAQQLMAAAAASALQDADWIVFLAAGSNQSLLGTARTVGFRTCYWLRSALAADPSAAL